MSKLNRILYAEDENDIRVVVQIALEEIGHFTVKYCSSGKEALDAVDHFQPDLLLLDVMMPGMDGISTLKELRKKQGIETTPVIFMTAKVQSDELERYKKMGVLTVIHKPFDPMKLVDDINHAWAKYYG